MEARRWDTPKAAGAAEETVRRRGCEAGAGSERGSPRARQQGSHQADICRDEAPLQAWTRREPSEACRRVWRAGLADMGARDARPDGRPATVGTGRKVIPGGQRGALRGERRPGAAVGHPRAAVVLTSG